MVGRVKLDVADAILLAGVEPGLRSSLIQTPPLHCFSYTPRYWGQLSLIDYFLKRHFLEIVSGFGRQCLHHHQHLKLQ